MARIWVSKLLDEQNVTKSTPMSTEIQQPWRICQNGGKSSDQTGTVLCGVRGSIHRLHSGFHAICKRAIYLQTS